MGSLFSTETTASLPRSIEHGITWSGGSESAVLPLHTYISIKKTAIQSKHAYTLFEKRNGMFPVARWHGVVTGIIAQTKDRGTAVHLFEIARGLSLSRSVFFIEPIRSHTNAFLFGICLRPASCLTTERKAKLSIDDPVKTLRRFDPLIRPIVSRLEQDGRAKIQVDEFLLSLPQYSVFGYLP